ncbi:hypothetical protein J8L70_07915 [Pseudoalteromonas sp. MMG010]|uniref:hypothetical protein n=1 Tax=Pseudoalteromonas sp. MMG010 TaxID=2822685 RepID=UPI001B39F940|nr:hypothetical protein [Pseudoalteromonas sp. MMG010]MBQ4833163.1 hypothetical protein [Pseudoalteromonas sp. MMG010]
MVAKKSIPIINTVLLRRYVVILLMLTCPQLIAKETIIWRVTDWPPFYILHGEHKGEGLYDQLISLFEKNMPEYTHQRLEMNTLRVQREWEKGTHICHPSVIPADITHNSLVNSFLLPHRVITHKKNETLFQSPRISLKEIFSKISLKGGITPKRYTDKINQLITPYLIQENLIKSPIYTSLVNMLVNKRIDYLIEYNPVVTYAYKVKGLKNPTSSFAISETSQNDFLEVVVGCNKDEWGKQVIQKINAVLIKESQNPHYLDSRLAWYEGRSKVELNRVYQQHYHHDKQLVSAQLVNSQLADTQLVDTQLVDTQL